MKRFVPDWYPDFRCIASHCRHSCCIGWEVDVSEDALARYDRVRGPFGDRLRRSIARDDCPHFILGEGERCPFLNEQNLCDIYIELGEEALCQICADHPRWRNWFADRVEEGLGLCCEAATRLLLTHEAPVTWLALPGEGVPAQAQEDYLRLLQARQALLDCLQNRAKPLQARLCEAFSLCGIEQQERPFAEDLEFLMGLEILDPNWAQALNRRPAPKWDPAWDRDGEQILCYLIQRYYLTWGLERWAEDFPLRFGELSLRLLGALYGSVEPLTLHDRVEFVRAWSAELEYSEENLEAIADYLL